MLGLGIEAMEYFAVQVKTRAEERFIKLFKVRQPQAAVTIHFPRKRLPIRQKGMTKNIVSPIFPGYIFLETEGRVEPEVYWVLRRIDGFFRFLKSNQDVRPLSGRDLETVLHFIRIGPVAEKSKVYFDDSDRIIIQEGPLKGLEGLIVKVDKRKGRAKIKLDLYDDSFAVDLAFEVIART